MTDLGFDPAAAPGPLLDVWAKIGISLDTLTGELRADRAERARMMTVIRQVPLSTPQMTLNAGAGTIDIPDLLMVRTGYYWSVRRLTLSGWSAGSVTVWKNNAGGEVLLAFPVPSTATLGRGEVLLEPGARLTVTAAGITGSVQMYGAADMFEDWYLPYYLG